LSGFRILTHNNYNRYHLCGAIIVSVTSA
jgi:hypothetical protein